MFRKELSWLFNVNAQSEDTFFFIICRILMSKERRYCSKTNAQHKGIQMRQHDNVIHAIAAVFRPRSKDHFFVNVLKLFETRYLAQIEGCFPKTNASRQVLAWSFLLINGRTKAQLATGNQRYLHFQWWQMCTVLTLLWVLCGEVVIDEAWVCFSVKAWHFGVEAGMQAHTQMFWLVKNPGKFGHR